MASVIGWCLDRPVKTTLSNTSPVWTIRLFSKTCVSISPRQAVSGNA